MHHKSQMRPGYRVRWLTGNRKRTGSSWDIGFSTNRYAPYTIQRRINCKKKITKTLLRSFGALELRILFHIVHFKINLTYNYPKWIFQYYRFPQILHPCRSLTRDATKSPWWHHPMETFFALLALCEGNPQVTGGFPHKGQWRGSFDIFCDLHLNKRTSKQSRRRWFQTPSR